ncbi:hypothetical protein [Bradyrhizobium sp. Leo121]|uniref:hypothetical protein n=1 Tax=Bradyrhizobium sp. Leo121 TaxID=1571195 RepID=UPI0013EF0F50|nr:hypothetical protein [Bradyrhizobium sp. Leo121]
MRKKGGRRPHEPDVYYVIAIDGRDWSYLLSLNTERAPILTMNFAISKFEAGCCTRRG